MSDDPFDEFGNLSLTDSEIDEVLDEFDDVPEVIQRQIVAASFKRLDYAMRLLRAVQAQAGNQAPDERRHVLTPNLRDKIQNFIQ